MIHWTFNMTFATGSLFFSVRSLSVLWSFSIYCSFAAGSLFFLFVCCRSSGPSLPTARLLLALWWFCENCQLLHLVLTSSMYCYSSGNYIFLFKICLRHFTVARNFCCHNKRGDLRENNRAMDAGVWIYKSVRSSMTSSNLF